MTRCVEVEQVPSIVIGAGPRPVVTIVVATCMLEDRTEVFVLDPPPDPPDDNDQKRSHRKGFQKGQEREHGESTIPRLSESGQ